MTQPKRNFLDSIDRKLVKLLLKDGRASFKTLAAEVGLTAPACAERVRRLREEGVIKGYRADVDWNLLGLPINALIRIGAAAEHGKGLLKAFRDTPNVIEVLRVTGSDSYVVHILARSSEELETVIDKIGSFGVVNTSLVLSTPLPASERVANTLGSTD
ncbi:Lrp/AsnC family transcriptional regulator [Variovorax terrae]|uniref:Lrp/AsnC family transcriptional regulator n=1 Tax=Variovorax terrae TaxID=2923278 RepID=A0A9X2APU8_9BURK|nr:Lrp/AsnC family transcriptional regulator [Variovorax terrae]